MRVDFGGFRGIRRYLVEKSGPSSAKRPRTCRSRSGNDSIPKRLRADPSGRVAGCKHALRRFAAVEFKPLISCLHAPQDSLSQGVSAAERVKGSETSSVVNRRLQRLDSLPLDRSKLLTQKLTLQYQAARTGDNEIVGICVDQIAQHRRKYGGSDGSSN